MLNNIIWKGNDKLDDKINKIINLVNVIQNHIFEYHLNSVFGCMNDLIGELIKLTESETISKDKIYIFNEILEEIITSFEDKDYLLLSDILKFKLERFLENI